MPAIAFSGIAGKSIAGMARSYSRAEGSTIA